MMNITPLESYNSSSGLFLGIDMGGTHTDAVLVAVGAYGLKNTDQENTDLDNRAQARAAARFRVLGAVKVPTCHEDLLFSAEQALTQVLEQVDPALRTAICRVSLGTTLGVNAVVRKTYDPVGLVLSAGPGMDPMRAGLGEHTVVVKGGLDHRGVEIAPLDVAGLAQAVEPWRSLGLTALACVSKFSPRNPVHEEVMARVITSTLAKSIEVVCSQNSALKPTFLSGSSEKKEQRVASVSGSVPGLRSVPELRSVPVTMGHRLSGQLHFPRRVATAYWNAAVWRLHNAFADAMEAALARCGVTAPVYLLKADGGAVPLGASREAPVEALLSGPAASVMGVLACFEQSRQIPGFEQSRQIPGLGHHHPFSLSSEDVLVLDMGGTTTDIALLARGVPVLSASGLTLEGRSTLVRSLKTTSLGLGGDSLLRVQGPIVTAEGLLPELSPETSSAVSPEASQNASQDVSPDAWQWKVTVGPDRAGPAMAFGGTEPTFLDALNVLEYGQVGDVAASLRGLERLSMAYTEPSGSSPAQAGPVTSSPVTSSPITSSTITSSPANAVPLARHVAQLALEEALGKVCQAVNTLLDEVNSKPVYTLAALVAGERVSPQRAVLVGGPAAVVGPLLAKALGMPVLLMDTDGAVGAHGVALGAVTNALGAALTRPTAVADVFADTRQGVLRAPALGVEQVLDHRATLEQVKAMSCALLRDWAVQKGMAKEGLCIDILEAQVFATLDDYGRGGRDMRVRCQLRPGVIC